MDMPDITQSLHKLRLVPPNGGDPGNCINLFYKRRSVLKSAPAASSQDEGAVRASAKDREWRGRYEECQTKGDMINRFLADCKGHRKLEQAMLGDKVGQQSRSLK